MKYRNALIALLFVVFGLIANAHAKDDWIEVRSKNFALVGDASDKEIRKVATKLEQFRETFRQLFSQANLTSPIPTTVFVFKSNSAFRPFKPKRNDGKPDDGIAGYFQPGEDVNYITLSTEGDDAETYGTIFHEYVHFIVETNFGKADVPTWFNEGLAEYYQTFQIEQDQKVKLGLPQSNHLMFLQQTKLMPIDELFRVSNYQLHATGGHSRSIFYAQSWALIHYFFQTGKRDAMNRFLTLTTSGVPQDKAFADAFKVSYAQMDKELRQYVSKSSYQYNEIVFSKKLLFDADMRTSILAEHQADALLGDLLLHSNRADDAEPFLARAISGDPASVLANTAMGMVKMRQRKWSEAKKFLDVAVSGGTTSHLPYYRYAFILSRESQDEFGYVREFPEESADRMRKLLLRAIELAPSFGESYELLAYVSLVNNDKLDDAVAALRKALKYQPHNQRYSIRIAEILIRQSKFDEAGKIAEKIAATAEEPELKQRAETVMSNVAQWKKVSEMNTVGTAALERGSTSERRIVKVTSEADMEKYRAEANRRWISSSLRKTAEGEVRIQGKILSISCKQSPVVYTIKTASESVTLSSKDFEGLSISVFSNDADGVSIGCDAKVDNLTAMITYRNAPTAKPATRGEIVAIEFVSSDFVPMTAAELATEQPILVREMPVGTSRRESGVSSSGGDQNGATDIEKERRDAIYAQMRAALRNPGEGEKRVFGYLETIECNKKGRFLKFKTDAGTLTLDMSQPQIRMFIRDLEGLAIGCGMRSVEFPAVVVFSVSTDKKDKHAGSVLTMDFVPRSFTLE
ncbi:MAG: DUF1570 domain-containing protein [Blastocatellia bacterium]|nr:DUF1570 domain-containing protein [Blastocatellia bacterium]